MTVELRLLHIRKNYLFGLSSNWCCICHSVLKCQISKHFVSLNCIWSKIRRPMIERSKWEGCPIFSGPRYRGKTRRVVPIFVKWKPSDTAFFSELKCIFLSNCLIWMWDLKNNLLCIMLSNYDQFFSTIQIWKVFQSCFPSLPLSLFQLMVDKNVWQKIGCVWSGSLSTNPPHSALKNEDKRTILVTAFIHTIWPIKPFNNGWSNSSSDCLNLTYFNTYWWENQQKRFGPKCPPVDALCRLVSSSSGRVRWPNKFQNPSGEEGWSFSYSTLKDALKM